jgi:predicted amidohydrolase
MTVHIPEPSLIDRLLKRCGKSRGVIIPEDAHCYHGKEKRIDCRKESLLITLRRSRGQPLPGDRADIFLLKKVYGPKNRCRKP